MAHIEVSSIYNIYIIYIHISINLAMFLLQFGLRGLAFMHSLTAPSVNTVHSSYFLDFHAEDIALKKRDYISRQIIV